MIDIGEDVADVEEVGKEVEEKIKLVLRQFSLENKALLHMNSETHCWRLKDRMKTVSVALVLCLNIPVDPPDVVKLQPCARLEAWVDPQKLPARTAIDAIGISLQKAYERWQPKARYKCARDPTADDIKKLCTSLRRNAKEERVLFHYNGHGVPKPTDNGEIWVFNSNYTQYIPMYIFELQKWMGTPSIYVYDCSNAGKIVKHFKSISTYEESKCIQLAACTETQELPMNPDLPADLFTACLTTPLKMAIKFFMLYNKQKTMPVLSPEALDKIPGQFNDRRSMLGELNWIFTAITDTIAWNTLSRELFQKLFRQDLLVASLFRSFLLAERVMSSFACNPVSSPRLPSTIHHPMWDAWDCVLNLSLAQLPYMLSQSDPASAYVPSDFFDEQVTCFKMWLELGSTSRQPPEQLPIVLQVLLSQVYRPKALQLLGSFLGLGPWAVNLVLEVGIFPYILKLLQSADTELRPLLTLLWAKILAVDPECKADLVRENGGRYFADVLKDFSLPVEIRTMAAFVMCSLVSDRHAAANTHANVIPVCLELLLENSRQLRMWAAICAAKAWDRNPKARWEATRDNAPDKLIALLDDPVSEVRASAAYALGLFIISVPIGVKADKGKDQGRLINHKIAISLKDKVHAEASSLVRQELLSALHCLVLLYEGSFIELAKQYYRDEQISERLSISPRSSKSSVHDRNQLLSPTKSNRPKGKLNTPKTESSPPAHSSTDLRRAGSSSSPHVMRKVSSAMSMLNISSPSSSGVFHEQLYKKIWNTIVSLERDPSPDVSSHAHKFTSYIKNKIMTSSESSLDASNLREVASTNELPTTLNEHNFEAKTLPHRKTSVPSQDFEKSNVRFVGDLVINTGFFRRCSTYFMRPDDEEECESWPEYDCDMLECSKTETKWKLGVHKLEEEKFVHFNSDCGDVLSFHPDLPLLLSARNNKINIWNLEESNKLTSFESGTEKWNKHNRITSLAFINHNTPACLLCTASNDGSIRVWNQAFARSKGFHRNSGGSSTSRQSSGSSVRHRTQSGSSVPSDDEFCDPPNLVFAFNAFQENILSSKESNALISWEQRTSCLTVAGSFDKIRLWDLDKEVKYLDIPSKGANVSALHSLGTWLCAGYTDGYLRLFDWRIRNSLVREWKDHSHSILYAQIFNSSSTSAQVISGAVSGEVRLCDLRRSGSVQVLQPGPKMNCMAFQPDAHMFAVGLKTNQIGVYHTTGSIVNTIQHYRGYLGGQKMGVVKSLAYHPSKLLLASATKEGVIAVHGIKH